MTEMYNCGIHSASERFLKLRYKLRQQGGAPEWMERVVTYRHYAEAYWRRKDIDALNRANGELSA